MDTEQTKEVVNGNAFIRFERQPADRKTEIWYVVNTLHGDVLGRISWFSRWRQYAFFPGEETVFNPDCLDTVSHFIRARMDARKINATDSVQDDSNVV